MSKDQTSTPTETPSAIGPAPTDICSINQSTGPDRFGAKQPEMPSSQQTSPSEQTKFIRFPSGRRSTQTVGGTLSPNASLTLALDIGEANFQLREGPYRRSNGA